MKNLIKKIMPVLIALAIVCLGTIGILIYKTATRVTVNFDLVIADYVENSENFEPVKIWKNKTLKLKEIPEIPFGTFAGWLVCDEKAGMIPFDESSRIKENTTLVANWTIDETDSDGDGVADVLENYFGTNPNSVDSDGDGFSDYIELMAGTDPNKYCSEAESKELQAYIPFDFELDTDGDGANDAWEKEHGTSPYSYDNTFYASESSEDYSGALRATVYVELDGKQVDTLNVSTVSTVDCPYVSSAIAGYMGQAFEFSVDGSFDTATIEFEYDRYEYGRISDSFLPQIYYVNEKTGELELLPDQKVENGLVSATVHHFSKYILLNKVEFDKVWEKAVLSPSIGALGNDVVFLMDNSASMTDNDGEKYRYTIVNSFTEQFSSYHRTAIIYYEFQSHVLSPLGTDRSEYAAMLNGLTVDKGTDMINSGSSSISALRKAMEMYDTFSRKKIVVLMSDGRDSGGYKEDAVTKVIEELKAAGVIVFTVGFGDVDETVLKRYAEETGGAYMYVQNEDDAKKLAASVNDNEDVQPLDEDLNGDKIPDFYAKLLSEGEMALSNGSYEFKGVDFTNPDIDGDGLLNGEELIISYKAELNKNSGLNNTPKVFALMKANPISCDTDGDGAQDKVDSEPLAYTKKASYLDPLLAPENFYYENTYNIWKSSYAYKGAIGILTAVTGTSLSVTYQEALLEYFSDWGEYLQTSISSSHETRLSIANGIREFLGYNWFDYTSDTNDIMSLINEINDLYREKKGLNECPYVIHLIQDEYGGFSKRRIEKLSDDSLSASDVMNVISMAMTVRDIAVRAVLVEEIAASAEYFNAGMDLLETTLLQSDDIYVQAAIRSVMLTLENEAEGVLLEVTKGVVAATANWAVDKIFESCPVATIIVQATKLGLTACGTGSEMEQIHALSLYHDLSKGARMLVLYAMGNENGLYVVREHSTKVAADMAVNHLGRINILGEDAYYEYILPDYIFAKREDLTTKNAVSQQISYIKEYMNKLDVPYPKTDMFNAIYGKYQ